MKKRQPFFGKYQAVAGWLGLICLWLWAGCKPEPPPEPPVDGLYGPGVYIVNEGTFLAGNGSIAYYDPVEQTLEEDIFQTANGIPTGDVVQSIVFHEEKAYIVANNSGRMWITDDATLEVEAEVNTNSPRFFAPVGNGKGYLTDLYSNSISVVDLNTQSVETEIVVGAWTEELLVQDGRVFVTLMGANKLLVINPATHSIEEQITVGKEPNSIVEDKNGDLWVLCSGGLQDTLPALFRIEGSSRTVAESFYWSDNLASPSELELNTAGDQLYWLDQGVWSMSITDASLPSSAWVEAGNHTFYGLGIDPAEGSVYVSDALDYVQTGWVYRLAPSDGAVVDSFQTGIIPGGFTFQ